MGDMYESVFRRGFGLDIEFIDHLLIVTTSDYNSLTELYTPNITVNTAHIRSSLHILTINWTLTSLWESESESELLYDWRFTANQFVLATSPLRLKTSIFFFWQNTCFHNPYVTSSLTRGWVYRLQLLLVLASAVIFRSESRGTHDHILLSQIQDSPNLEGQVPVFISPRNRVARL
jgi:hypothetical protein